MDDPICFVTCGVLNRKPVLADRNALTIFVEVWKTSEELYGWKVGSFCIMPDHVHFFCAARRDGKPLSMFVGKWKEWTSKPLHRRFGWETPLWQSAFFDHVLRSGESYTEKWRYVRENPVRAGLVSHSDDWPFSGTVHRF